MKIAPAITLGCCTLALLASARADEPQVDDPMLEPIPATAEQVRSWDDALARIRHAPDYLASVAAIERAQGDRRIALAAVLPTLNAIGSYQYTSNVQAIPFGTTTLHVPVANLWTIEAVASWTLDARSVYEVGTANREVDVSRLSFAERRRELADLGVDAMLATLTAERIAELNRTSLRASLERLQLTKTRLAFAHGTELDVDRAQQDVETARGQLVQGDESVRVAREALGELFGSPTPITPAAELAGEELERAIATSCRASSDVEQRADVSAARARVDLAARGITDAQLRFAPSITASSVASDANASTLGPSSNWTIGAAITVPLYDGGVRYGALRKARADLASAQQAFEQTRVAALIDAAREEREVGVAVQTRDVAKRERDLAAQVDARVRQGYAAGLGTSLDLVTSAQALRRAEIELATAEFQVTRARAGAVIAHAECVF